LTNEDPSIVTVWSDIGCPWASLALHTLRSRAKEREVDLLIDHRAFPLELFNSRPTPKAIIDVEVTAIAGLVPSMGWRLWSGREAEYVVSTLPPMAAVQAAKSPLVGGLRASSELDGALRHAFYVDGRCITVYSEILDVASTCESVDVDRLRVALESGAGYAEVFNHWHAAGSASVQGSPHLFVRDRYAEHNPGVNYHWTGPPGRGFPRFERYDTAWVDELLAVLGRVGDR